MIPLLIILSFRPPDRRINVHVSELPSIIGAVEPGKRVVVCTGVPEFHQELYIPDSQKERTASSPTSPSTSASHLRVESHHLLPALQWGEVPSQKIWPVSSTTSPSTTPLFYATVGRSSTSASHLRVESQHLLPALHWEEDFSPEDNRVQ